MTTDGVPYNVESEDEVSLCLRKAYIGVKYRPTVILEGGECVASRLGRFTLDKQPPMHNE
jgi:hypothetical protein